jgi:23S rRNA (adenine2503-C2)-methyltransferase
MIDRVNIFGKTLEEIQQITSELQLPSYTSLQLTDWLYKKRIASFDGMSNLAKSSRKLLGNSYQIKLDKPSGMQLSVDGTKKYLFSVNAGNYIESVFIPELKRSTLCLSSQIGCKMNCLFCMTGKQGFQGNLSVGEILNQIVSLPERDALTNYVFMGMGEPLDNTKNLIKSLKILTSGYGFGISALRITVSTIGLLPDLKQLINESDCHIAISLHSPFESERYQLVPLEKAFPVSKTIRFLKDNRIGRQRRISFEYIMFKGFNDTARHINGLTRLLNGLRCRINLIRYHSIPGVSLESSDDETIKWFKIRLNEKGILTTLRSSRGRDIFAACGMLSTKHYVATGN